MTAASGLDRSLQCITSDAADELGAFAHYCFAHDFIACLKAVFSCDISAAEARIPAHVGTSSQAALTAALLNACAALSNLARLKCLSSALRE